MKLCAVNTELKQVTDICGRDNSLAFAIATSRQLRALFLQQRIPPNPIGDTTLQNWTNVPSHIPYVKRNPVLSLNPDYRNFTP